MIVVADTTPLISLLKINRLDLLRNLFGEVYIPKAVFDELTVNPDFTDEAEIVRNCDFISIQNVNDREVSLFRRTTGLDLGESEALVLTDSIKADLILIDEIRARQIARTIGFNIMGTVGILRAASRLSAEQVNELKALLKRFESAGEYSNGSVSS